MNILLVEDSDQDIATCKTSNMIFCKKNNANINIVAAKTIEEGLEKITDNVDVAIMDMKLGSDGQAGCTVISKMNELSLRIPTVVYTATPDEVEEKDILKVFKKGASTYEDIFNYLSQVYKTGITDILGHKGFFESKINEYYENIFLQQKDVWMDRLTTATSEDVKKSLLRTVIYHLEQLLEASTGKTFFEEFYLNCCDSEIHTGSLLKKKNEDIFYVIMSPACDLVEREDKKGNLKRNIDTITLCEIEPIERYGYTLKAEGDDKTLGNDKKNSISTILKNNKINLHWLPGNTSFCGGILNYTKITSYKIDNLLKQFNLLKIRISSPYMKNILSRFASYYARQGQPDLDVDLYVENLKPCTEKSKI